MKIFYDDAYITVCEKPAGVLSQTGDGENMISLLKTITGHKDFYPVHRLDTAASGIMVYAKTAAAAAVLSKAIAENEFTKEYLCLVHGAPEEAAGEYTDLLFKDARKNKSFVVKKKRRGVKEAKLSYQTLRTGETKYGTCSLVRVRLSTGRTHQIRVQFSSRKTPLLGDGKYGAKDNCPFLALYSARLSFPHPITGEEMTFKNDPTFLNSQFATHDS